MARKKSNKGNSGVGNEPTPELEHDTATGNEAGPKADFDSSSTPQDGKAPAAEMETIGDEAWLAGFKPLADYVARIGAFQRSFKRYAIYERYNARDDSGYWSEVGSFTITKDGEITTRGAIDPPIDDERKPIKDAAATVKWPEHVTLAAINKLPDELTGIDETDPSLFIFRDNTKEKRILMLQQRAEKLDDSGKYYVPWTFWSDGQWRRMEPEGLLPLWGLEHIGNHNTIFLHEGAKAARFVQNLIDDKTPEGKARLKAHPWGLELSRAAHLGWIGGAKNPHRTDWGPIRRLAPNANIYVVADNDRPGFQAIPKISRQLKRRMYSIKFDRRFPASFDFADEWPTKFWKDGLYAGPRFRDHVFSATWAADLVKPPKGKAIPVLRDDFAREWVRVGRPAVFIHEMQPDRLLDQKEFEFEIAPFTDASNVAQLLAKENDEGRYSVLSYRPYRTEKGQNSARRTQIDGVMTFNIFRPSTIRPNPSGDITPFIEYMKYLIPDEMERHETMRWIATLIARPEIRMHYALLLISITQGVGKTTLGTILAPLVGRWNCSWPNEEVIVNSQFNTWASRKRLAIVNELYSGDSFKAYDKLKTVVTDATIEIHEKYQKPERVENFLHVLACSNSIKALRLDVDDRRWFAPRVTERRHPDGTAYWKWLYGWLEAGGFAIIAHWAEEYVTKHEPVRPGDRPPFTARKQEIIDENMTDGRKIVRDLVEHVKQLVADGKLDKVVVRVSEVQQFVADARKIAIDHKYMEKPLALRKTMVHGGWHELVDGSGSVKRIKFGKNKDYIVANFDMQPDAMWSELAKYYKTPGGLMMMTAKKDDEEAPM